MTEPIAEPDYAAGIEYWNSVDASVDGVLGGFGDGPLPTVDQAGSRMFLLSLIPTLQRFASPLVSQTQLDAANSAERRYTALDVGAGIGRVTAEVLLPLCDDIVTIEPVRPFIEKAASSSTEWRHFEDRSGRPKKLSALGNDEGGKRVWFIEGALNDLDPAKPLAGQGARSLGVRGGKGADEQFGERAPSVSYDVIWCQWCLGHLNDAQLVAFLKRSRRSLKESSRTKSYIVVKENVCENKPNAEGSLTEPNVVFDDEDSSLTRSEAAWKRIFQGAELRVVKEEVQEGLPEGLFMVKSWALR